MNIKKGNHKDVRYGITETNIEVAVWGGAICDHHNRISKCIQCGGTKICQHNRQKEKLQALWGQQNM